MSTIKRTLVLTGAHAGRTIRLAKTYQFIDGKITLKGSGPNVEALSRFLAVNFAAHPEGSLELEAANGQRDIPANEKPDPVNVVLNGSQPAGEGAPSEGAADSSGSDGADEGSPDGRVSEGDGHENSRVSRIQKALSQLDPTKPDHWVANGLPAMAAVEFFLGESITRAELSAVAPDFNREG